MRDALIIGGGPAGLYAASRLAAAGFSVDVLEEHADIGEPVHCTGVLAAEAFEEFQLSRASILNELTTALFWSPSGRQVTYAAGRVEAVVVDRRSFDQRLLEAALAAGVVVQPAKRATAVEVDSDGVTVRGGDFEIRARVCVLACGANYALQRQLGLGMPRLFLQTAQMELAADGPDEVELYFGLDVAPKGFGWAVPVQRPGRDYVRIGVMCDHDAPRHFTSLARRIAERWHVREEHIARPRQKILPLAPISRTYGDRLLAVGDAAGLVKPTTGGGIYYSLVSGALAADVLVEALRENQTGSARLARYEQLWRDRLSDEFQTQLSLRLLAHRMSDADIDELFELARTDGIMPIVRRTASFNRHRKLILALFKHPPVRQLLLRRLAF